MLKSDIYSILSHATSLLIDSGSPSPRLDATVLLAHALGTTREKIITNQQDNISDAAQKAFNELLTRRLRHEPLAYIMGKKEFWSLDFSVTRDTLIPRPDSETLIEAALHCVKDRSKPASLLDIGTGTGCLIITLLKELPNATGVGVDNNQQALAVAKQNAAYHQVTERAEFRESHWLDALNGTFDLIVSNPPYITENAMATLMPDVKHYEPHGALVAGTDGLDAYRTLAPLMPQYLNEGGHIVFEVGMGQAQDVAELLRKAGMHKVTLVKDLAGIERCVIAQMN